MPGAGRRARPGLRARRRLRPRGLRGRRVAAPDATFGFTEVRLGIIPAVISPFVFAKIGPGAARRFFLTGERFDAETALRIGLVHEVADDLDAAVERVVGELLQVRARRRRARRSGSCASIRRDGEELARIAARLRTSDEGQEGLRAFLEQARAGLAASRPEAAAPPRRRDRLRRHDVLRGADAAAAALRATSSGSEGRRRRARRRVPARRARRRDPERASSRRAFGVKPTVLARARRDDRRRRRSSASPTATWQLDRARFLPGLRERVLVDGRARVARRRRAGRRARRADRQRVRRGDRRRAVRARARRRSPRSSAPRRRSAASRCSGSCSRRWAAATPRSASRAAQPLVDARSRALGDRRVLASVWFVALPALSSATLGVLAPLRLDASASAPSRSARLPRLAPALEATAAPLLGARLRPPRAAAAAPRSASSRRRSLSRSSRGPTTRCVLAARDRRLRLRVRHASGRPRCRSLRRGARRAGSTTRTGSR